MTYKYRIFLQFQPMYCTSTKTMAFSSPHPVSCVAAMSSNRGIGKDNVLPWPSLKADLEFLDRLTLEVKEKGKRNALIFGRRTWIHYNSLDKSPLTKQVDPLHIVLSNTLSAPPPGADYVCPSVSAAVQLVSKEPAGNDVESIFIMGGEHVYQEAIQSEICQRIYLTHILKEFEADAFFPNFDEKIYGLVSASDLVPQGIHEDNGIQYKFCVYERRC